MTSPLFLRVFSPASQLVIGVFLLVLLLVICNYLFGMLELLYAMRYKKPLFVHFSLIKRRLKLQERTILEQQFPFYQKLSRQEQRWFRHRVKSFLLDKHFIGREGLAVTAEIQVLISATAVMLTFGFRNFYIGLIERIVVYPDAFFSKTNQAYHKGEFNPRLKTLALSWSDFKAGMDHATDNLNLGVHELAHAIHLNSLKNKDVNSVLFVDGFKALTGLLQSHPELKTALVASAYFRNYAYTNPFEFLAVLIEHFIETPEVFQEQFPELYDQTKQMLNFDFAGY